MCESITTYPSPTVGMTVGVIEVLCLQPFNYCKNMIQQGQPLTADPRKLYRGVGANAVNMGSCTMIQFAVGVRRRDIAMARLCARACVTGLRRFGVCRATATPPHSKLSLTHH